MDLQRGGPGAKKEAPLFKIYFLMIIKREPSSKQIENFFSSRNVVMSKNVHHFCTKIKAGGHHHGATRKS